MRGGRLACEPCETRSPLNMLGMHVTHDERLVASDDLIDAYKQRVPDWIKKLERPATPAVTPTFGPLAGIRAVGTGVLIAQPYIGTKLAEFGAEVIHIERAGGDTFRTTAPFITRGPRPHGADEAEVAKNKLSMGLDLKQAKGVELLMALWKISDVWMESSAPGTLERNGICNELALAVNPPPGHRAGLDLRTVRPARVSRPSGIRRLGPGLWRNDEHHR